MTRIIDSFVEDAKAVTIGECLDQLHLPHPKGRQAEYIGPCPLSGGKDRFSYNIRKNVWNCRGCNESGHGALGLAGHVLGLDLKKRDGFWAACSVVLGRPITDKTLVESEEQKKAGFGKFWTTIPLLLSSTTYNFNQGEIALFSFAGAAGVIAATIAGKVADRGFIRGTIITYMISIALYFIVPHFAPFGSKMSIVFFVVAAILLDCGVTTNLVVGQRVIYGLAPELRSQLNDIHMVVVFVGEAFGSAVGGHVYSYGGWTLSAIIGLVLPIIANSLFYD